MEKKKPRSQSFVCGRGTLNCHAKVGTFSSSLKQITQTGRGELAGYLQTLSEDLNLAEFELC